MKKKIIVLMVLALAIFVSPVSAMQLGRGGDLSCIIWRVGMSPTDSANDISALHLNICKGDEDKTKRIYELETAILRLEYRLDKLENENKSLKESSITKQEEIKQLLLNLIALIVSKR